MPLFFVLLRWRPAFGSRQQRQGRDVGLTMYMVGEVPRAGAQVDIPQYTETPHRRLCSDMRMSQNEGFSRASELAPRQALVRISYIARRTTETERRLLAAGLWRSNIVYCLL